MGCTVTCTGWWTMYRDHVTQVGLFMKHLYLWEVFSWAGDTKVIFYSRLPVCKFYFTTVSQLWAVMKEVFIQQIVTLAYTVRGILNQSWGRTTKSIGYKSDSCFWIKSVLYPYLPLTATWTSFPGLSSSFPPGPWKRDCGYRSKTAALLGAGVRTVT